MNKILYGMRGDTMRLSLQIEKLENYLVGKYRTLKNKHGLKLYLYLVIGVIGFYFYGLLINSIHLGIDSIFSDREIATIWVFSPLKNLLAIFSFYGLAITAVLIIMVILITKKGYSVFSGQRYTKDKRGFDILHDGTHGTSGWLSKKEIQVNLELTYIDNTNQTVLGKLDDEQGNDQYVTQKSQTGLNDHIIVFGASGTGKSRGFIRPFAFQTIKRRESIVLVDPKAEFYEGLAGYFEDEGYTIRMFNLLDMENSDGWNCIKEFADNKNLVQSVAEEIIRNTSNLQDRQNFWENSEKNLLMALLLFVESLSYPGTDQKLPLADRSLGTIYKLLSQHDFAEIDAMFSELPSTHPAQAPYGIFKKAGRQLWGNIAIGLGSRLNVFQNTLVDTITRFDDIDLELPGKQPCAYFCVISDYDSSLEFLSSLFFSTLLNKLIHFARRCEDGRLPVTTNICLEEFCNIGKLSDFKKLIAIIRSRGINAQLSVQGVAMMSERYPKNEWAEIVGNIDCQLFLGANDLVTAKYFSEKCGSLSVKVTNDQMPLTPLFSPVYSTTRPYSQTRSSTQRMLMQPDEILRLPLDESLIFIRGMKPIRAKKIIPEEFPDFHKLHYKSIHDYIPKWHEEQKKHVDAEILQSKTPIQEVKATEKSGKSKTDNYFSGQVVLEDILQALNTQKNEASNGESGTVGSPTPPDSHPPPGLVPNFIAVDPREM